MMHIVNYDDGGWVIVAGDKRESNQILAMGETGNFDPDNITNPNVAFWFESQMAIDGNGMRQRSKDFSN